MTPNVSVVVPVGSFDEPLGLQLEALAAQDHGERWELVLSVNRAGARRQVEAAAAGRTHPRATIRIVDSSSTRGAAHARNAGVAAAAAPLLAFCDGDDLVESGWLAAVVAALRQHPAIGGYLDERWLSPPRHELWRPPATPGGLPTFFGRPYPVAANMGLRREAFDTVGGFAEDLTRCAEIALGWALSDCGLEPAYAPAAVVHYRHRPGLWPMIRQHHLYGVGMSEVLVRHGRHGDGGAMLWRANRAPVERRSLIHGLRRAAIASGRLRGLIQERLGPTATP